MKRIAALTLIALLPLMAACNTVNGAGKDISAAGHTVQDASKP